MITLAGVSKSYQRQAKRAVDNLSLEVKRVRSSVFSVPTARGRRRPSR